MFHLILEDLVKNNKLCRISLKNGKSIHIYSGKGGLSIYDVGEQYVAIQNDTHIDFYPFTSIDHIEIW